MRTDRIVDTVNVYNSECMGCERVERDIMVTFVCDNLRDQLNKQIEYNWQNLPIEERRESKIKNILE